MRQAQDSAGRPIFKNGTKSLISLVVILPYSILILPGILLPRNVTVRKKA